VTDRLSPLGGLLAALAQPAGDHHPVALAEGIGQVLGLVAPHVDLEEAGVAVAPLAVLLDPLWVTATRRLATAMPLLVKRSSGSSTKLPTVVVWLSAAMIHARS